MVSGVEGLQLLLFNKVEEELIHSIRKAVRRREGGIKEQDYEDNGNFKISDLDLCEIMVDFF